MCPDARGVLLVPENHTRNTFYLQNVATLAGHPAPGGHARSHRLAQPRDHQEPTRDRARRRRARSRSSRSCAAAAASASRDFDPCMVLLNNDLSAGPPAILDEHRPADRAAACRRLVQPPEVAPLRGLPRASRSEFAALLGIDPVARRSVLRRLRRDRLPGARRRGVPRVERRRPCSRASGASTPSTASTRSRSSSSRPTPAPTAWAS